MSTSPRLSSTSSSHPSGQGLAEPVAPYARRFAGRMQQWREALSAFFAFVGRQAVWLAGLGVLGTILLVWVEIAFTAVIQLMLTELGLLAKDTPQALPWLQGFQPEMWQLGVLLLLVGLVRFFGTLLAQLSSQWAMETVNRRLRMLSAYSMLLSPNSYVSSAEASFRNAEIYPRAAQFYGAIVNVFVYGVQCLLLAVMMFSFAWRESLVAMLGLAVIGGLSVFLNKRIQRLAVGLPHEYQAYYQGLERVSRHWLLIKAMRTEWREFVRLRQHGLTYSFDAIRIQAYRAVAVAMPPLLGILLVFAMLYTSRTYWHTEGMLFVACLYMFIRFIQTVSQWVNHWTTCVQFAPHFGRAKDMFFGHAAGDRMRALAHARGLWSPARLEAMQDDQQTEKKPRQKTSASLDRRPPEVSFRDIWFRYAPDAPFILQDFCLELPAGGQVALVGPSGSGKSTTLFLLMGLYQPERGQVLIDGQPVSSGAKMSARATGMESSGAGTSQSGSATPLQNLRVGYVGPDPYIFSGSLRDNILYGLEPVDAGRVAEEDIWQCLKAAHLSETVHSLPAGLEHQVDAKSDGLSAGQKQRLALARALMLKPHLLILDEPTANLDEASEAILCESLAALKGRCSMFIVSHRKGILKYADEVVRIGLKDS